MTIEILIAIIVLCLVGSVYITCFTKSTEQKIEEQWEHWTTEDEE